MYIYFTHTHTHTRTHNLKIYTGTHTEETVVWFDCKTNIQIKLYRRNNDTTHTYELCESQFLTIFVLIFTLSFNTYEINFVNYVLLVRTKIRKLLIKLGSNKSSSMTFHDFLQFLQFLSHGCIWWGKIFIHFLYTFE